jgi:hypothetical protein
MTHRHNADPANGPVCSHLATDDILTDLGFPVRKTETSMGHVIVRRDGTDHAHAVHAAWIAGAVRICTCVRPDAPTGEKPAWLRRRTATQ